MTTKDFKIEDIDGCEFVISESVGKLLISFQEEKILVVYADASTKIMSPEQAQMQIDSGQWELIRRKANEC